jgi:hypothetical protein
MLKIHAIQTGTVKVKVCQRVGRGRGIMRQVNILLDRSWTDSLPIYAWAVETSEGVVVVDTGETARTAEPGYFPRWHPYFRLAVRLNVTWGRHGMKEIHTEVEINAPAERVWRMLTDFRAYPEWNPFVRRVEGEARVGARLHVDIQPSSAKKMSFRPTVLAADPNRELRWLGRLWLPGLFDGEHSFSIEPLREGRVRFVQRERFGGLLVPFLWKMLDDHTRRGFEEMNRALKLRAESAP